MKKLIVCLALLLAGVLSSMAITFPFSVNAPKFKGIAVSTAEDGVNIRKSPSATAPRLIYDESKIEAYDVPATFYGFWSSAPLKRNQSAIKFYGPNLTVNEQDGWLEIWNIGPKNEQNGWVSAKYCKMIPLRPVTPANYPNNENFIWLNVAEDDQGLYALVKNYNEMDDCADFYVGRVVNGVVVCPYSLYNVNCQYEESATCRLEKGGYSCTLYFNSKQSADIGGFKLNYVPSNVIQDIIQMATPGNGKDYVWFDYNMYYALMYR